MIRNVVRSALVISLFLIASATRGHAQLQVTPTPGNSSFQTLLERAKKGDKTLDFKELRLAYTDTADYKPYSSDRDSRQKMFAALNAKEYDHVLEYAEKLLAQNYLDLNAHFGAVIAHRELGNADKAALHKFLFDGLIASIEKSGDGKSPGTAFVVISTDEEYVLLNWLGLRATDQSLVNQGGHSYDLMKAVNSRTNETVSYYFNIDKPFNWLGKSLKP